jgi:hypothetical protein
VLIRNAKLTVSSVCALHTTQAVVAGLVALELLKLNVGNKKLESYNNSFLNLAVNQCVFACPCCCVTRHALLSANRVIWMERL